MRHDIILPDLGQTTTEAKIIQWLKSPGDRVSRGEPLVVVQTDKVDMEVEAFESGYVRELRVKPGDSATALSCIAVLTDSPHETYFGEPRNTDNPAHDQVADAAASSAAPPVSPAPLAAAPAARMLAKELGIDLANVSGTGPKGLISKEDVRRYAAEHAGGNSDFRALAAMAAMTTQSKRDIPHFYVVRDLDMQAAADWRQRWNAAHPTLRASFNDVFIRAAAFALAETPRLNTAYSDGKYEQRSKAEVRVVAARDSALVLVPVPDLRGLSWEEILRSIRQAMRQSAPQRCEPVFVISNLGMHAVREFSAIIPPGCTAILAIGAVREAPIVVDGRICAGKICTATLSLDHRVVDGVRAAQFLDRLQFHLNSL